MSSSEKYMKIINKAWNDKVFLENLKTNPKKTLKENFDINLPENCDFKVLEEKSDLNYIIIPPKPPIESINLKFIKTCSW